MVQREANLGIPVNIIVTATTHRLIVVDAQGRPDGLASDGDVVSRTQPAHQRTILNALQRRGPIPPSPVTAHELLSPEVVTAMPETLLTDAVQKMLAAGRKWMIVVGEDGKPVGLLDRQALLMAVTGNGSTNGG